MFCLKESFLLRTLRLVILLYASFYNLATQLPASILLLEKCVKFNWTLLNWTRQSFILIGSSTVRIDDNHRMAVEKSFNAWIREPGNRLIALSENLVRRYDRAAFINQIVFTRSFFSHGSSRRQWSSLIVMYTRVEALERLFAPRCEITLWGFAIRNADRYLVSNWWIGCCWDWEI